MNSIYMPNNRSIEQVGISGMALYVPRLRVKLKGWCEWTNNSWDKVKHVVGHSFRICGMQENVYTMAANAVMRLIRRYDIDPQRVGFFGLGTESSRDNSAGAVIVRGMVDNALTATGSKPLSRNIEVPEFKHACLGGVYALKAAFRYVTCDHHDRLAIVVAGDIAEYERGSTGEPTQGAGAVAMLVEREPKMLRIDMAHAGSASAYRGPDFRKPFARHFIPAYSTRTKRLSDFPIFSGKYSTMAYLDEVVHAVEDMLVKIKITDGEYYRSVCALFFHRPYRMMPVQAISFLYVRAMARGDHHRDELDALCNEAEVSIDDILKEIMQHPDLYSILRDRGTIEDPFPATGAAARVLRNKSTFRDILAEKMNLGSKTAAQFGNLYTAALPAWIAAGIEDAQRQKLAITDEPMVMVGYGSGDAAEAIPFCAVHGWEIAASHIGAEEALANPVDLEYEQYKLLHDGIPNSCPELSPHQEFIISRVGDRYERDFQDLGVEYYDYVA